MNDEKHELLMRGVELMKVFCSANGMETPDVDVVTDRRRWLVRACAYYRPTTISICPAKCAVIGRGGASWSYPGYMVDRTPFGVIQHELGHHVDWTLSESRGRYGGDFSSRLRSISREPPLTGYCPNDWEWYAEMHRLFVTNPDLLHAVRPRTYKIIREVLTPVVDRVWWEVLEGAPERTVELARRRTGT